MKNRILLLLLLITYQTKTNCISRYFKDLAAKIVLIYVSNYSTTLIHELGHALAYKMRGLETRIAVGDTEVDFYSLTGLVNFTGFNPDHGVTLTQFSKENKSEHGLNIIGSIMGPVCGISFRLMQLAFLEKFKDLLSPTVFKGLRDFMIAKNIQEAIYGFTPFNNPAVTDGTELFNELYMKYNLKNNVFYGAICSYKDVFINIRSNFLKFYLVYNFLYYFLKYFETAKSINGVIMGSRLYTSSVAYTKEYHAYPMAQILAHGYDEFKKSPNQGLKWYYKILIESLIF